MSGLSSAAFCVGIAGDVADAKSFELVASVNRGMYLLQVTEEFWKKQTIITNIRKFWKKLIIYGTEGEIM